MSSRIATLAGVFAGLLLTAGPALAQGAFTGIPAPSMDATPAEPAPAPPAEANALPDSVPRAQAVPPQGGTDCGGIQSTLAARKDLVTKANAASNAKKKMSPQEACGLFGKLVANGTEGLKWITTNREWCSIPDSFADGFKGDHDKVVEIKTKVCDVAAQVSKMEAQARAQGANGGGGGLLGGPGLTGTHKLPQGAL